MDKTTGLSRFEKLFTYEELETFLTESEKSGFAPDRCLRG